MAAGLHIVDGTIGAAAIGMGGVAAMPWRVAEAEDSLLGQPPIDDAFR